jgi:hypothetical protein
VLFLLGLGRSCSGSLMGVFLFSFSPTFFFIYIYCVISFVLCSRFDCVLFLHGTKFFFPLSSVRKVIVHIDV